MDYKPRYTQPFTLGEATLLDVSVITEEIARLQNSLQHLTQTQKTLGEYINSEPPGDVDPEITKAIEENEIVIGSQEERIGILKLALAEKGVLSGSHYDLPQETVPPRTTSEDRRSISNESQTSQPFQQDEDDGNGIHL